MGEGGGALRISVQAGAGAPLCERCAVGVLGVAAALRFEFDLAVVNDGVALPHFGHRGVEVVRAFLFLSEVLKG